MTNPPPPARPRANGLHLYLLWMLPFFQAGCVIDTTPVPEDRPRSDDGTAVPSAPAADEAENNSAGANAGGETPTDSAEGGAGNQKVPDSVTLASVFYAEAQGGMLIVATENAFPGIGLLGLYNPRTASSSEAKSAEDGSYVNLAAARLNDTIQLTYSTATQNLGPFNVELVPPDPDSVASSARLADALKAQAGTTATEPAIAWKQIDATTIALVGQPDALAPMVRVVAGNLENRRASSAVVQADGSFRLTLSAKADDTIVSFAVVEGGSSRGGGVSTFWTVP